MQWGTGRRTRQPFETQRYLVFALFSGLIDRHRPHPEGSRGVALVLHRVFVGHLGETGVTRDLHAGITHLKVADDLSRIAVLLESAREAAGVHPAQRSRIDQCRLLLSIELLAVVRLFTLKEKVGPGNGFAALGLPGDRARTAGGHQQDHQRRHPPSYPHALRACQMNGLLAAGRVPCYAADAPPPTPRQGLIQTGFLSRVVGVPVEIPIQTPGAFP
ncbi:Uncharacterised protein [Mycobacteroides abscessus subsp. abscessus]|nr:Uncharacterised protein [Mycobacteroides abscessus subsp. abscessus]